MALTTVLDDLSDLPARITASADRVEALLAQLSAERETRDRLVVEAVDDARMTHRTVAAAARLSQPQIIRILAAASEDG
jgi:hypothetical protein